MADLRPGVLARALPLIGFTVCLGLTSCQVLKGSSSAQGLSGRIAWPKDGDLWVYDLATKQQTKITDLPSGAAVTGATWSPDGQRIVFAQFWRRPNERSSGADLMIANGDGSNAHSFADRDAPNTVLETPAWMPSGQVYYTMRQVNNGRETQTIVRQIEGGQPEKLVDNAYDPAPSADESTLVYVRTTRAGQSMLKKTLSVPGDGCELVSDQVFQYLSLPRISPDGKRVAFGGSGEPTMGATGCGGDMRSKPAAAGGGVGTGQQAAAGGATPHGEQAAAGGATPHGEQAAAGGRAGAGVAAAAGGGATPHGEQAAAGGGVGTGEAATAGGATPHGEQAAAGGANPQAGGLAAMALAPVLDLAGWLQPEVAYAHGLPADVYSMTLDGSDMVRIADIKDDDPTVAWSPDGARLAIFGVAALYVVDSKGGPTDKLVDQGGYGGLGWSR